MTNKAFTLIEITIVVTIIAILGTIFIANYRGGEKQFALKRSAHKLAQDLRTSQEMAMSAKLIPSEFGEEAFPQGGYGIYFQEGANSYILFADWEGEGSYSPYPDYIKELFLEEGISIISLSPASIVDDSLVITFFPPDPVITINPVSNFASITIGFNGQTKTVSINSAGLIAIDD